MFPAAKLVFSKITSTGPLLNAGKVALLNPNQALIEACRGISATQVCHGFEGNLGPKRWPRYNKKLFPPQEPEEERRPAYVCHMNLNFKYHPDKLWYVACLVRGMTIDEALRQISYVKKKGAWLVEKTLREAQDLAAQQHHVEFKSNLWVAESFVGKGLVVKGIRRHARKRIGQITYRYSHYFVRLEEGTPTENIYPHQLRNYRDGPTLLQQWIEERRKERIYLGL